VTSPLLALLVFALFAGLLFLAFRPRSGWVWLAVRASRASERVLMEDALKHLFDGEYKGQQCTLMSVSGALGVSADRTAEVLGRLEEQELVRGAGGGYELTSEGRTYALRVVRIHRLWERYLADETGLAPEDWHKKAEEREHRTSAEEAEALSASLGHPRYDPHGDPIPTAAGDLPKPQGRPLTELAVGDLGEIVHLEDEPAAVYAQLVAEGLHPWMRVRILEVSPQRIRFEAGAEEHILAPVIAANVSVVVLPEEEELPSLGPRMADLALGEKGRVVALAPALRGLERRRFLDLGLVPGTEVEAEIRSPGGDPTGYRVRGAVIALRREQAEQVEIERLAVARSEQAGSSHAPTPAGS
jgi:DtxR family Mn-dependent transcriptional regulator